MSDSPPPAAGQTNHKAWAAGIGAAVAPIVLQNVFGASDSFSVIYDWLACHAFGTACPTPEAIAAAFKALAGAIGGGIATGVLTNFIANKPKT